MQIHERARQHMQTKICLYLPLTEKRTARAPEWLRAKILRDTRRALVRRAGREAVHPTTTWHPPRVGLDSGRAGGWFLGLGCVATDATQSWGWWRYAAARRGLALAGMPARTAIEIARQAAACTGPVFAPLVGGSIPPAPTADEADCAGWDRHDRQFAARSAEDARRIRQWTAWFRGLRNDDAQIGRRMRRWIAACVRHERAQRAAAASRRAEEQQRFLAAATPAERSLYDSGVIRCGCIRVRGTTVHEMMHDIGTAMTSLAADVSAEALAARQRAHDAIYHRAGERGWWPAL